MFLNGEVDFCDVPTQYRDSIIGQPGIRCHFPLPPMSVGVAHFEFDINPTSPYGNIFDYGVLDETGVPRDFFGNPDYGIDVRKAFIHCIDFNTFLTTVFLGEAMQPPTVIIPPITYYDPEIQKYEYNLTKAAELFHTWPGLWDTGFTIRLIYKQGSSGRQFLCEMLATAVNSLNPAKFHVEVLGLDWASYVAAMNDRQLPIFLSEKFADYPDLHSFVYPYYHSGGTYAARQGYSDPVMDALIDEGIRTPDGPERREIYSQIQQRAIDIAPALPCT